MSQKFLMLLSAIFLCLSMANAAPASSFAHPQPPAEPATTKPETPDPKKLDEAAATITALKHCLAMDGSLNQQARLIDAYNNQPDLDNLPNNMSDAEKEKVMLYTMGRPDIPDFGFLMPDIWRLTKRDARIRFDAIMALKLSSALGFKSGALAFSGNCKPVMQGDITTSGNFEHATIAMPLAFNENQVQLAYLMTKQQGYNWQIEDLLINNAGVANYVRKDLVNAIVTKGLLEITNEICKNADYKELKCTRPVPSASPVSSTYLPRPAAY